MSVPVMEILKRSDSKRPEEFRKIIEALFAPESPPIIKQKFADLNDAELIIDRLAVVLGRRNEIKTDLVSFSPFALCLVEEIGGSLRRNLSGVLE